MAIKLPSFRERKKHQMQNQENSKRPFEGPLTHKMIEHISPELLSSLGEGAEEKLKKSGPETMMLVHLIGALTQKTDSMKAEFSATHQAVLEFKEKSDEFAKATESYRNPQALREKIASDRSFFGRMAARFNEWPILSIVNDVKECVNKSPAGVILGGVVVTASGWFLAEKLGWVGGASEIVEEVAQAAVELS